MTDFDAGIMLLLGAGFIWLVLHAFKDQGQGQGKQTGIQPITPGTNQGALSPYSANIPNNGMYPAVAQSGSQWQGQGRPGSLDQSLNQMTQTLIPVIDPITGRAFSVKLTISNGNAVAGVLTGYPVNGAVNPSFSMPVNGFNGISQHGAGIPYTGAIHGLNVQ